MRPCQEAEAYKLKGKEHPGREKDLTEGSFWQRGQGTRES